MKASRCTNVFHHVACFVAVAGLGSVASAQPPGGPEGSQPPRGPLLMAIDANHDRILDADEIKNASTALLALDKNGDGRLVDEEMRPPMPPGGGPGGAGGPPREGRPGGPGEGGRPRGGPGGGPGNGPGQGGPGGPPSPERFVERAMSFDGDGDGKLDRSELEKFAAGMMERMRGGPGGPGNAGGAGGGPERPERGDRPERPEGGDRPGRSEGGDRPERPRRPE